MLSAMFIIFEVVALIFFVYGLLGKGEGNDIKTILSLIIGMVLFGVLMVSAWHVEVYNYQAVFNGVSFTGYEIESTHKTWPAVGGVNILFFALSLLFTLYDVFLLAKDMKMGPTRQDTNVSKGGF